jgi:hypothetical protein
VVDIVRVRLSNGKDPAMWGECTNGADPDPATGGVSSGCGDVVSQDGVSPAASAPTMALRPPYFRRAASREFDRVALCTCTQIVRRP